MLNELSELQQSMFLHRARELVTQALRPSRSFWHIVENAHKAQIKGLPDPRKATFTRVEVRRLAAEVAAQMVVRFLVRHSRILDPNELKPLEFEFFEATIRRLEDALDDDDPGKQDLITMRRYHELSRLKKFNDAWRALGVAHRAAMEEEGRGEGESP